jgi:hypothetical protein
MAGREPGLIFSVAMRWIIGLSFVALSYWEFVPKGNLFE